MVFMENLLRMLFGNFRIFLDCHRPVSYTHLFLKTAKVFGPDREVARPVLAVAGCDTMVDSDEEDSTTFPLRYLEFLRGVNVTPAVAYAVLESDENGSYIQELDLHVAE